MTTKTVGRLVYIEPNDMAALAGVNSVNGYRINDENSYADNHYWNPEELNMSVDLQVVMPNREDCGQVEFNNMFAVEINNDNSSAAGRYVSFLQGSDATQEENGVETVIGHNLTTSYLEASYSEIYNNGSSNKECLGIESVDITFDSHFYPQVNIRFIDVRGYSLMMPTDLKYRENQLEKNGTLDEQEDKLGHTYNNFFRALFHFPYPRFLLTIKGYYGNSITFMLAVNEFRNNFNSQTGNFEVNVSFIGYMYGLYTDIPFNFLICAPYLGVNTDDSTDAHATGDYWPKSNSDTAYLFDSGNGTDGTPICTFIDYIKSCDKLNQKRKELMEGDSGNQAFDDARKANDEVEKLKKLLEDVRKFLKGIVELNENDGDVIALRDVTNGNIDGLLILSNTENKEIKYNIDAWNAFVDDWEKYQENASKKITVKTYPSVLYKNNKFLKDSGTRLIKTECTAFYTKDENTGDITANSSRTCGSTNGLSVEGLKTDYPNLYSKLENCAERYYQHTVVIPFEFVVAGINERINELNKTINENSKEASNFTTRQYVESLGFDPTINNYYRMIFAHINSFMDGFYTLLSEIKKSNRTLNSIGIEDRDLTDLNNCATSDSFVPPFPAFYKKEDNKRQSIYPGETEAGKKLLEVQYVEKLLNGAIAAKESAKRYITDAANDKKYDEETKASEGASGVNFTLTSMTDTKFDGVNPYSKLGLQATDKNLLGGLLYYFTVRYASSKFQISDDLGVSSVEADNFLKVHPSVPSQAFKDMVSECISDNSKILNVLKEFYTNNGSDTKLVTKIDIGSDKVTVSEPNVSLYSSGIKKGSAKPVYYKEKSSSTFLYDSYGADRVNDVANIRDAFQKGSYGSSDAADKMAARVVAQPSEYDSAYLSDLKNGYLNGIPKILSTFLSYDDEEFENKDGKLFRSDKWKNLDNKQKLAKFLQVLVFSLKKEEYIYSSIGTICGKGREISVNISENKSCISSLFNVTAMFVGAILSKQYGDKIAKDGVFYSDSIQMGEDYQPVYSQFKTTQIESFNKDELLKKKFIAAFDNFAKSNAWTTIVNCLSSDAYYNKDVRQYGGIKKDEMKDNLRKTIVEYMFKGKYYYIYNVCDENGSKENGDTITISLDQYKTFLSKINEAYKTQKSVEEQTGADTTKSRITNAFKLEAYTSLKNLYDKWANSYTKSNFELRSPSNDRSIKAARYINNDVNNDIKEFDNFVFIDSFYNDISYKFRLNPDSVYQLIISQINNESNYSVYEFMADICQENKLLFLALPVINNFYSEGGLLNIFSPQIKNTMKIGYGSTYVCMYTYEVSHVVEDESQTSLSDDGIDLCGIVDSSAPTNLGDLFSVRDEDTMNFKIPAFGVTYARQNQQYFKNISVNMDNPRVTDYSIANLFQLANFNKDNTLDKPYAVANDVYSIYANRSYNCTVDMMGCANIMPLMYFQLNNIPMFRGAYIVTNVEHHIRAGEFTTSFTGVRISKNQLKYNDDIFNFIEMLGLEGGMNGDEHEGNNGSNGGSNGDSSGDVECTDFDVTKAVARMKQKTCNKAGKKCRIPYEHTDGSDGGFCTRAVLTFVAAGEGISDEKLNGMSSGYGVEMAGPSKVKGARDILGPLGFECVETIPADSTRSQRQEWTRKNALAGDIACMYHGDRGWSSESGHEGHACMYSGDKWVSDFAQVDMYVYGKDKDRVAPQPIYIMRHKTCSKSTKKNDGTPSVDGSGSNYKVIAKGLMDNLGFNKEQIIGIMSAMYQESNWNPKARNPKSTARGIAQWMCSKTSGCRQKGICDYINGKYGTSYQPVGLGDVNDKVHFIDMPLKYQVEGLIDEMKSDKFRDKISKVKAASNAKSACDLWTSKIEGVSADSAHRKWIDKSREEYKAAFG